MKKELLIGCGSSRSKQVKSKDSEDFENLTTLDINQNHNPNIIWDLRQHPLPFKDNSFDEIHAYHVLEHLAYQGDYEFFFSEWSEYWRILKSGGIFCGVVPHQTSPWAIGDPSHKRIITEHQLTFLSQKEYTRQIGVTSMSDFRDIYKADFTSDYIGINQDNSLIFVMKAVK